MSHAGAREGLSRLSVVGSAEEGTGASSEKLQPGSAGSVTPQLEKFPRYAAHIALCCF